MKMILVAVALSLTSMSFGATCKLTGRVNGGFMNCYIISTKLKVDNEAACRSLAESTNSNRFFNIIENDDILLSTNLKFKDGSRKVKERITFSEDDDDCFMYND